MSTTRREDEGMSPLAWGLLAVSTVWCGVWFVHALGYWEDDAWIHLEFARSLAAGRGFSFNGHVVYGDTSPMWVWLLVGFHAVIRDWMAAGKTLTVVAAGFALGGFFGFARALVRGVVTAAAADVFAAAMVVVLVVNPYFGYWAFSGMEALAAAGLVCWGLWAAMRVEVARRFVAAAVVVGVAPLLRPEMSFFSVLLGGVLVYRWGRLPGSLREKMPRLVAGLVVAAAPGLMWARYAVRTFGMIVPNTNAAKRAAPGDSVVGRLVNVYALGFPVAALGVGLLVVWAVYVVRRRERLGGGIDAGGWVVVVWTGINCVFYVANHTYVQTRYIFVTATVLTVVVLAMVVRRWPLVYRGLVGFAVVFGVGMSLLATWPLVRNKVGVDRVYAENAAFLRTLPADAAVAHYSIGEAAFLSEHPIVDIGGITRPGIVPFMWDKDEGRKLAWMEGEGARYLITDHQPMAGAALVWSRDLPVTGWFLDPRKYRGTEKMQVWTLKRSE